MELVRPDFADDPIPALPPLPPTSAGSDARVTPVSAQATSRASTQSATASAPASRIAAAEPSSDPAVRRQYENGMRLLAANKWVEARGELSEAYFSNRLTMAARAKALTALDDLADRTLLSGPALDGDPYTGSWQLGRGDTLLRIIERERLAVTPAFLCRLNAVEMARLPVGRTLKLIRGPVHAVVYKGQCEMDLYLHRDGQPRAFLKRLKVGVGRDGSTPEGQWLVVRKAARATWSPPPSATETKPIAWGQSGYPLGKDGYWIALQGCDENTANRTGYGLHGTDEPESIGKAASLGCVRLADDDIELAYSLLVERASTVTIRP